MLMERATGENIPIRELGKDRDAGEVRKGVTRPCICNDGYLSALLDTVGSWWVEVADMNCFSRTAPVNRNKKRKSGLPKRR